MILYSLNVQKMKILKKLVNLHFFVIISRIVNTFVLEEEIEFLVQYAYGSLGDFRSTSFCDRYILWKVDFAQKRFYGIFANQRIQPAIATHAFRKR